jgi:glutathione synthase/RimK-type ligase-like ATP-grasp enzyme
MQHLDIGLVTSAELPNLDEDSQLLLPALANRGLQVKPLVWTDPAVDWSAMKACLVRSPWDYTHQLDAFLNWARQVSRQVPLWNPLSVVEENTHKGYLRTLEAKSIPIAPTHWLAAGTQANLQALMTQYGWTRGILKPAVSASSYNTLLFDLATLETAQSFLENLLADREMMVQPYLQSIETQGELSFIFFEGRFSHAVRKIPATGDFRVQEKYGGLTEAFTPTAAELASAEAVINAAQASTGPLLYARVDQVYDEQGVLRLMELELTEPSLYLLHDPAAAGRFADCLQARLAQSATPFSAR